MAKTKYFILLAIMVLISINTMSQCLDFAKKTASSQMSPYVADGNYNACDMREGETAEMYKTFFEGQSYRLIVAKAPNLPPVYIRVVDKNGAVLFDNQKMNYTHSWDFKVQSTQMLVVQIKVLDQKKATKEHGCVGILFGMETSKKK